jgi:hypothetical protein
MGMQGRKFHASSRNARAAALNLVKASATGG